MGQQKCAIFSESPFFNMKKAAKCVFIFYFEKPKVWWFIGKPHASLFIAETKKINVLSLLKVFGVIFVQKCDSQEKKIRV